MLFILTVNISAFPNTGRYLYVQHTLFYIIIDNIFLNWLLDLSCFYAFRAPLFRYAVLPNKVTVCSIYFCNVSSQMRHIYSSAPTVAHSNSCSPEQLLADNCSPDNCSPPCDSCSADLIWFNLIWFMIAKYTHPTVAHPTVAHPTVAHPTVAHRQLLTDSCSPEITSNKFNILWRFQNVMHQDIVGWVIKLLYIGNRVIKLTIY